MSAAPRLSPSDWATVVTLYERGDKNIRELAEMFGVTPPAIRKGLKQRGIQKASRLGEVVAEVEDKARAEREAAVRKAKDHQENYAKWSHLIAQLTIKKITEGEQGGNLASKNADLLVLGNGMKILEKARKEGWEILSIEDLLGEGSELPDLNVGEYSESELEKIREANEQSYLEGIEGDHEHDFREDDDEEEDAEVEED